MKRITILILTGVILLVLCTGCVCEHEWQDATCETAKTCVLCQEAEGEALGHMWSKANCTDPKKCSRCGITEGEALGHEWKEATCTKARFCAVCRVEDGKPLGHTIGEWQEVTVSTCTIRGEKQAECSACGETLKEALPLAEHVPGEWVVKTVATSEKAGIRVQLCKECSTEVKQEEYTLSAEEIRAQYIQKCDKSYTYEELARNPDKYLGDYVKLRGEVIQVMVDGDEYTLRVNITKGRYYWEDPILVTYTMKDSGEDRILEEDIVLMYGMMFGDYTYETVMGAEVTVPLMFAEYIDIE